MSLVSNRPPPERGGSWWDFRSTLGIGSLADWLFRQITQSSALLVVLLVALIVALLSLQAWPAMRGLGVAMVAGSNWDPTHDHFGGLPFIYGSVITSVLAMLLAVPLGVGAATFLAEVAPAWLRRGGSFLVELLAAIPSVVYGFWGIYFLAPNVQKLFNLMGGPNVGGKGLLSAGLILAVMIVPYIAAVTYDVCQAVPRAQREGALALGATRWQTIWGVVLPYARPAILGGCFLALGRAIGETMAVTMLIGNTPVVEMLPFGRGYTIPSLLAQKLPSSSSLMEDAALIELSLLLFVLTIVMNSLAHVLIWRVGLARFAVFGLRFSDRGKWHGHSTNIALNSENRKPKTENRKRFLTPLVVNYLMTGVLALCLVLTCIPLFLILGYITYRGADSLSWDFFTKLPRPQGEMGGGLANALAGSGILVLLATLLSLPIGLLAAIFLSEFRNSRLTPIVRFFGELLGGVPSIVIGTFVYAFVRLFIQAGALRPREQFSGWAGAFALAILMVPIFMRAAEEALRLVPQTLRNASYALGAHQWQTVLRVIVPAALPAIITAAFLAIARIAGETAPLLMTVFGNDRWAFSPSDKMGFLPLYIYQYSMSGDPIFEKQAWSAALVLLAFVMVLNVGIRLLTGKRVVLASRAE
ncbi:MAG TPA: phosphate ABC transporter permease subunit PstC [Gemmataceae bacterium]|nr:phosphate ABC transporter permease subunit PstC [Gemmataceae bacterium]